MPYTEISDFPEIVDHAHAVLGSITLIQTVQSGARKGVTTEAVFDFGAYHLFTVLNTTHRPGLRFETVVTSAGRACLLVPSKCQAQTTIHSAWCDQHHGNGICLYRSFLFHIYLLQRSLWRLFLLPINSPRINASQLVPFSLSLISSLIISSLDLKKEIRRGGNHLREKAMVLILC